MNSPVGVLSVREAKILPNDVHLLLKHSLDIGGFFTKIRQSRLKPVDKGTVEPRLAVIYEEYGIFLFYGDPAQNKRKRHMARKACSCDALAKFSRFVRMSGGAEALMLIIAKTQR